MKNGVKWGLSLLMFLFLLMPSLTMMASAEEDIKVWKSDTNVPLDKTWTINLNKPINTGVILDDFVYVVTKQGERVDVTIAYSADRKKIFVEPPKENYKSNTTYTLVIEEGVQSEKKDQLNQTVHKEFTTGASKEANSFKVRSDSANEAVMQNDVIEITEKDIISVTTNKLVVTTSHKYVVGDILALPATAEEPFGYFRKITAIELQDNHYVLTVTKPKLEEIIKELDVSKKVAITEENLVLSEELDNPKVSAKYVKAFGKLKPSIEVVEKNGNVKVIMDNIGYEIDGETSGDSSLKGSGMIKLDGALEFEKPTVNFDVALNWSFKKPITIKEISLSMEQIATLNAELVGEASGEFSMPLASFPVPMVGMGKGDTSMGVMVNLDLVYNVDLNGKVKVSVMQSFETTVGMQEKNDKLKNISKVQNKDNSFDIPEAAISLDMGVGFQTKLSVGVGDYDMADANITPTFEAGIEADAAFLEDEVCIKTTADILLKFSINIDPLNYTGNKDSSTYQLMKNSNCDIKELVFVEDDLSMLAGKSDNLQLMVVLSDGRMKKVNLPSDSISFKSNNRDVKVTSSGKVIVSKEAKNNSTAQITAKYKTGLPFNYIKTTATIHLKNPDGDFVKNYQIEATGDATATLEKGSYYVIYYSYNGKVQDIPHMELKTQKEKLINLKKGHLLIVSYKDTVSEPEITGEAKLKETTQPAFKMQKVKPKEAYSISLATTSIRYDLPVDFFYETKNDSTKVNEVTYDRYNDVYSYEVNREITAGSLNGGWLSTNNKMEIENVGESPFTLYVPTKLIKYQPIDTGIVSMYKLKSNETLKITTPHFGWVIIEPQNFKDRATAKYDAIEYLKNGKPYQQYGEYMPLGFTDEDGNYYMPRQEFVKVGATTLIENRGNSNLLVYAPKNMTMTATDEKVFKEYTLYPGKSITVKNTEPQVSKDDSYNRIYMYMENLIGQSSVEVSRNNKSYEKTYDIHDDSINLFELYFDTTYLVENKGNQPVILKGMARYTVFE